MDSDLARFEEGLQKLLHADADVGDIIDQVLAGDGNAAAEATDGDFVFKKPVGRAPKAKKKAAQTTFYSRKEVVADFQRQTNPELAAGPPVKGDAMSALMDVSERFMQKGRYSVLS